MGAARKVFGKVAALIASLGVLFSGGASNHGANLKASEFVTNKPTEKRPEEESKRERQVQAQEKGDGGKNDDPPDEKPSSAGHGGHQPHTHVEPETEDSLLARAEEDEKRRRAREERAKNKGRK